MPTSQLSSIVRCCKGDGWVGRGGGMKLVRFDFGMESNQDSTVPRILSAFPVITIPLHPLFCNSRDHTPESVETSLRLFPDKDTNNNNNNTVRHHLSRFIKGLLYGRNFSPILFLCYDYGSRLLKPKQRII